MRPPTALSAAGEPCCCSTRNTLQPACSAARAPPSRPRSHSAPRTRGAPRRRHLPAALAPTTPGPEIWLGAAVPLAVFVLGAWEFTKRILIQRACPVCAGTGLVPLGSGGGGRAGAPPPAPPPPPLRLVKCRACGGFFPWQSWDRFLSSAPGNGGPLRQPTLPRQAGVLYRVPTPEEARSAAAAAGVAGMDGGEAGGGGGAAGGGGTPATGGGDGGP